MENQNKLEQILKILGYENIDPLIFSAVQSLIFASDTPITFKKLKELLSNYESEKLENIIDAVFSLHRFLGIRLNRVGGGYIFTTSPENVAWTKQILGPRVTRFSKQAIETIAIIAYEQPCTQLTINDIRGANSESSIKSLLDKGLIRILGRKSEPGRPLLYGTTREFLTFFGINALSDLPSLEEEKLDPTVENKKNDEFTLENLLNKGRSKPPDEEEILNAFSKINSEYKSIETMENKIFTAMGININDEPESE
jgi:segregation and condensation protein B